MNMNNVGGMYDSSFYDVTKSNMMKTDSRNVAKAEDKKEVVEPAGKNVKAAETKLSEKAQEFLKNLREKYKDYDVFVGETEEDFESLSKVGRKEFSVIISMDEIEKMANDEDYANEKMQMVEGAIDMAKKITEESGYKLAGEDGEEGEGTINKISITIGNDGNMKFFAELEKTSDKQKERIEKAKEKSAEDKKVQEKKNPYGKKDNDSVKRTTVEASSMDELIEKIREIDWSKVAGSKSGDRFDFTA